MKAFVTGATGFVGSHVARVLAEQGADLRLLVRSTSDTKNIEDLKADRVIGDLRHPDSLEKGMAGCDVLFHVAADYRLWVHDPEQMYRSNVEGTRAVLQRARTAFGEWSTRQAWRLWASLETASPRTRIRPCPWTT